MEFSSSSLSHALTALFIFHHLTTHMVSSLTTTPISTKSDSIEFIKKSCNATLYPQLCYKSLSVYAQKVQTSPRVLAMSALCVTLSTTRSTSQFMKNLSMSSSMTPRETGAMLDCVDELADSVDELQKSVEEMAHIGGYNIELQINNIQTWVSAALTDDETCMDGFAGKAMNGEIKTIVRSYILKVAHLSSIALALFNNYVVG